MIKPVTRPAAAGQRKIEPRGQLMLCAIDCGLRIAASSREMLLMNPTFPGKIAVVGAGAVGCYYGGLLAHNGHEVHFLMRRDHDAVRRHGLTIHTRGRTLNLQVQVTASTGEIGPVDLVIIALKTTSNAALDTLLPPLTKPGTAFLTLQNGLGNEELLARRWGAENVLGALCFVCLNRTAPGEVTHFDHGSISIGEFGRPPSARLHALVESFRAAGIEAQAVQDLASERWRKLVWNIPFNGLAIAAGGATVAEVLADSALRDNARALMSEVIAAASALGHAIPESFADFQVERSGTMGPYKPSSMIDWQAGRPVEVDSIWGEPLRRGLSAGAVLPRLALLHALLRHLTRAAAPSSTSPS
jgi:2-dehydropantoate 2-reductase